jgi:hypothetical protein
VIHASKELLGLILILDHGLARLRVCLVLNGGGEGQRVRKPRYHCHQDHSVYNVVLRFVFIDMLYVYAFFCCFLLAKNTDESRRLAV